MTLYRYRARQAGRVVIRITTNRAVAFAHDHRAQQFYGYELPEMSPAHKAVIGALVAVATLVLINLDWIVK